MLSGNKNARILESISKIVAYCKLFLLDIWDNYVFILININMAMFFKK